MRLTRILASLGLSLLLAGCMTGRKTAPPKAEPKAESPVEHTVASPAMPKAASKGRKAGRDLMVMSIRITGLRETSFAVGALRSALMPYIGSIQIFDASDLHGMSALTNVPAPDWILRIDLVPVQEESRTAQVGHTLVKRRSLSRTAHVSLVSIADGISTLAFSVTGRVSGLNATVTSLQQQLYGDLMRKIADRLAEGCGCNLKVDFAGGGKPDEVLLYLDGRPFENGGYVLNGEYMLRAEFADSSSIQRKIRVAPGRPARITLTLEKQP